MTGGPTTLHLVQHGQILRHQTDERGQVVHLPIPGHIGFGHSDTAPVTISR